MMAHETKTKGRDNSNHHQVLFKPHFTHMVILSLAINFSTLTAFATDHSLDQVKKLEKEYSEERAKNEINELLTLGDEFREAKKYRQALATYEEVFLIDPRHVQASAKIDVVRGLMQQEGKDEAGIVKGVYDEEAKNKVISYWKEIRDYLKAEKYGQARFTLEKILLLDPFNQEAIELHATITKRFREHNETGETL